tara:strand:+ start:8813 stop:9478 length:666 start_codon:yes stop_codon:yes gene_type:complete
MKLYGLQFPIGKEKTHKLVAGVLNGYDGIYHLGQEQDLKGIIAEGTSTLEEYNHIFLSGVIFRISLVKHDNPDSLEGIPEEVSWRVRMIKKLNSQGQYEIDFNRFIETLHNCYEHGYPEDAAVHLKGFAEFLGWDKEGPPIKGLDDALQELLRAAELYKNRSIEKAEPIYDNLNDLIVSTWPRTIYFGIPWGPNKHQTYKEPLDYEAIARDIMEMGVLIRS